MSRDLYNSAFEILTDRNLWDLKQRQWFQMRFDGLPRLSKPFPTAADAHMPVIDLAIKKIKPFLIGQITSGDKLCHFDSLEQQTEAISDCAADYFNYELINRTDFLRKMRSMIDTMCLRGKGVIKATIDPLDKYAIVVETIDPQFILIPQSANGFEDSDEFVHVREMTVDSYKRLDSRWKTDEATVNRIRGQDQTILNVADQQKILREGITNTTNPGRLIIWEHWVKNGRGHKIYTYSPQAPDIDLRNPYGNPYKFQGKESLPFHSFQMEVTSEGWYASRGLAELLSDLEQYATMMWNEKADAIKLANTILYTGDKEIKNTANYRWVHGEYIPGNIKQVQSSPTPFDFDREIAFVNSIAEQQSNAPDNGTWDAGQPNKTGGKPTTATEQNRLSAIQSVGTNDSAAMLREDLAGLYRHIWGMICQFKDREFSYFAAGTTGKLPEQALHDSYLIQPDGSADGWNRLARFQKALGLAQVTANVPNVNPEPIWKEVLNAYDGQMALKAFVPTNLKGANEYEAQVEQINAMLAPAPGRPSFPATVKPSEDQASRIKAILDWLHACEMLKTPVDPMARQRVQQNLAQRIQMLEQQNPAAAKQIKQMIQGMEQGAQQNGASRNGLQPNQPEPQMPQ